MTIYDEESYDFEYFENKVKNSKFFRDMKTTDRNIVLSCCVRYTSNYIPPERRIEIIEALLKDGTPMKNLSARLELFVKRSEQFGINVIMAALKNGVDENDMDKRENDSHK